MASSAFVLWNDFNEREYLTSIGEYALRKELSRTELLQNYIDAVERRVNWGRLDKTVIIRFAKNLLKNVRKELMFADITT